MNYLVILCFFAHYCEFPTNIYKDEHGFLGPIPFGAGDFVMAILPLRAVALMTVMEALVLL